VATPTSSDYAKYQKYAKEREENGNNFYTNIAKNAEWRQNHKELLATFLTYYSQELEESSKSKRAESCLKLAIELWPEYSDSYWQMGDCLIKKEDLNGAWQVLSKAVEVMPPDDKFYGLVCYKAMYVRLMLMNGANNQEAVKDCTKIYEKVLVWENKIEKKYPFDHNDNVWRNTVKSQLSQFVSLASIGKKERNLTDPTKCTVCHTSGVKISRCGRCKKTWYCGVVCQRADWPVHKPNCM
jgi:tetratricopeptide (TPR) repeat protein